MENKIKSVVITGATGMLGVGLIKKCIENNIKVMAVVRKNSKNIARIPKSDGVMIKECNLKDIVNLDAMQEKYDVFYHLGWEYTYGNNRNSSSSQMKNIEYTLDAVRVAKRLGCHTFIGTGSQAEYGRISGKISPESVEKPESAYGIAKYSAGKLSRLLCNEYHIKHIWTRVFSAYSPFDHKNTMVRYAVESFKNGEMPEFTPAEQIWDYIYYKDVCNALYLLATRGRGDEVYCIGSGEGKELKKYIMSIREFINPKLPLAIGKKEYAKNQVMYLEADISKLVKDTGFKVCYSFEEGLEDMKKEYDLMYC